MSRWHPRNTTRPKPERQLNAKLLPLLVILFAALYALTGYRGWLAFLVGFGGAWLLGAVWTFIIARDLSIVRKIDLAWAHVGESVPEQLLITNKSRLSVVWIEIIDESDRLAEPVRLVTDIEPHITRRRTLNHAFKQRGVYRLGPTCIRTSDPLGIYTLTMRDSHVNTILVTPPQLPLAQLSIPPGGQADNKQHTRQTLAQQVSADGVRDYVPGDSLRRIQWHTSAHRDTLMVRQLEAAASEDWWIFADLDSSVQSGSGLYSTMELVIVLAASLVTRGLKEHHRVGLTLAGPKLVWMEPRSGPAQRWNLLCALAAATPGDRSLSDLFTLGRSVRTGSLIIITPTCDPFWVASLGGSFPGGSVKVLLVNSTEFGQPVDQRRVSALLSKRRIPYSIMPRRLLEEAYSSSGRGTRKRSDGIEARKRFMDQGRSNWQSID
jgi:uncharacterized protein (DUF58 family)